MLKRVHAYGASVGLVEEMLVNDRNRQRRLRPKSSLNNAKSWVEWRRWRRHGGRRRVCRNRWRSELRHCLDDKTRRHGKRWHDNGLVASLFPLLAMRGHQSSNFLNTAEG